MKLFDIFSSNAIKYFWCKTWDIWFHCLFYWKTMNQVIECHWVLSKLIIFTNNQIDLSNFYLLCFRTQDNTRSLIGSWTDREISRTARLPRWWPTFSTTSFVRTWSVWRRSALIVVFVIIGDSVLVVSTPRLPDTREKLSEFPRRNNFVFKWYL